jgi:hypothetical protein
VQARSIDQNDLRVRAVYDALDAIARRLRPRGYDGHFFSDQPVYERGFPRVGPAHDGDKTRFEFLSHEVCFDCQLLFICRSSP